MIYILNYSPSLTTCRGICLPIFGWYLQGPHQRWNLSINCIYILTCLNFSHVMRLFSTAQNSFWTQFWCLLVFLLFFVSPFPYQQNVSLWGLSSSRETNKTKKVTWGEIGWIERIGHKDHVLFGQKLLNCQRGVSRCSHKSPIIKWANLLKESSKNSLKPNTASQQQCQLVHWYRWFPRTLT